MSRYLAVICLLVPGVACGAELLTGQTAFSVLVEDITGELPAYPEALQARAELRLRKEGFTIVESDSVSAGTPWLYIQLGGQTYGSGYIWSLSVSLRELGGPAKGIRECIKSSEDYNSLNNCLFDLGTASLSVWEKGAWHRTSTQTFQSTLDASLTELLDMFVNDWMKANGK